MKIGLLRNTSCRGRRTVGGCFWSLSSEVWSVPSLTASKSRSCWVFNASRASPSRCFASMVSWTGQFCQNWQVARTPRDIPSWGFPVWSSRSTLISSCLPMTRSEPSFALGSGSHSKVPHFVQQVPISSNPWVKFDVPAPPSESSCATCFSLQTLDFRAFCVLFCTGWGHPGTSTLHFYQQYSPSNTATSC